MESHAPTVDKNGSIRWVETRHATLKGPYDLCGHHFQCHKCRWKESPGVGYERVGSSLPIGIFAGLQFLECHVLFQAKAFASTPLDTVYMTYIVVYIIFYDLYLP
jgi:hypothetical protein